MLILRILAICTPPLPLDTTYMYSKNLLNLIEKYAMAKIFIIFVITVSP